VTAAVSRFSKCSSVKEFLFLDLMLFIAENSALHIYVLPNMVSTFLQHLTISGNCPSNQSEKKFFQRTAAGRMLDSTVVVG